MSNGNIFDFSKIRRESYYCLAHCCHKYLWNLEPEIVICPRNCYSNWNESIISTKIDELLNASNLRQLGSVYTINSRTDGEDAWVKKYVGSAKNLKNRIKKHLVKKSGRTRSCLDQVKKSVCHHRETIAISWIHIYPAFLYKGIEEMIIGLEKTSDQGALEWNKEPGDRKKKTA